MCKVAFHSCIFFKCLRQGQRKICSMMLPALPSVIEPSFLIIRCRYATQTYTKEEVSSKKTFQRT